MTAEFTPSSRAAIYARDDGCVACGTLRNLTIQHRITRGMGGTRCPQTTINGLTLCLDHHMSTERHPDAARILGWRVDQHEDPETVWVWRHDVILGHCWASLHEDPDPLWAYWQYEEQDTTAALNAAQEILA